MRGSGGARSRELSPPKEIGREWESGREWKIDIYRLSRRSYVPCTCKSISRLARIRHTPNSTPNPPSPSLSLSCFSSLRSQYTICSSTIYITVCMVFDMGDYLHGVSIDVPDVAALSFSLDGRRFYFSTLNEKIYTCSIQYWKLNIHMYQRTNCTCTIQKHTKL